MSNLLSELTGKISAKKAIKGALLQGLSSASNVTLTALLEQLPNIKKYLDDSYEKYTALSAGLFLCEQDVLDTCDDVDLLVNGTRNAVGELSDDSFDSITETIKSLGEEKETDVHGLSITDDSGHVYDLISWNNGKRVVVDGEECMCYVSSKYTDSDLDEQNALIYKKIGSTKAIMRQQVLDVTSSHTNSIASIAQSLSKSSDINELLSTTVTYISSVSSSSLTSASEFTAYIGTKFNTSVSHINTIVQTLISAMIEGGFYGLVSMVIKMVRTILSIRSTSGNTLELTDNTVFMPQAWIAGAVMKIAGTVIQMASVIVAAISPVIGFIGGLLGSVLTSLVQAPAYAAANETTVGMNPQYMAMAPWFQLALVQFVFDAPVFQPYVDLLNTTGFIQVLEVPGGYLFVGLSPDDSPTAIAVEFHPGVRDTVWTLHEKMGRPMGNVEGSDNQITYPTSIDYSRFLGGLSFQRVATMSIFQNMTVGSVFLTKQRLEELWADAVGVSRPYYRWNDRSVASPATDVTYKQICLFNTYIFMFWSEAAWSQDGYVILCPAGQRLAIDYTTLNTNLLSQFTTTSLYASAANMFITIALFPTLIERLIDGMPGDAAQLDANISAQATTPFFFWNGVGKLEWSKIVERFQNASSQDAGSFSTVHMVRQADSPNPGTWYSIYVANSITLHPNGALVPILSNNMYVGEARTYNYSPSEITGISIPKYTYGSIIAFVAITIGVIAVSAVVAAVTVPKVMKWRRTKQRESQAKVEKAWSDYSANPTAENGRAYDKACKRANLGRLIWGGSKFSRTNYWDSGVPEPSTDSSGEEEDSGLSTLLDDIKQQATVDVGTSGSDMDSIPLLYTVITGKAPRNS